MKKEKQRTMTIIEHMRKEEEIIIFVRSHSSLMRTQSVCYDIFFSFFFSSFLTIDLLISKEKNVLMMAIQR